MKRAAGILFGLGMLTMVSATANASPVISVGTFTGGTAVLHAPGTLANGLNVLLGAVQITGDLGTFESYCVDLQHYDTPGANPTVVDTMDNWNNTATVAHASLGGGAASWLYNTFSGVTGNEQALSLAIWESLYDNDYTVSYTGASDGFYVTNVSNASYVTVANQMLAQLRLVSTPLPVDLWLRTQNSGTLYSQDFIGPVPEPATMFLLGTGLLGAAGFRRRRNKKTA